MFRPFTFTLLLILAFVHSASAQETKQALKVAILDFSESASGKRAADTLHVNLRIEHLIVLDRDQVRAAAHGIGYKGSLNLDREYARELGAVLGCEFYLLGDADTLRRSSSDGPPYFESYASLFLVSARTGNLIMWERPSFQAADAATAEKLLLADLSKPEMRERLALAMHRAHEEERRQRQVGSETTKAVIAETADGDQTVPGLQLPRPFRRLHPKYPDTAARADAEATVDVLADIDANGKVTNVEIARWAGFGLDQATADTVRQLNFFPAQQHGVAVPIRVLLRYNFRKPVRSNN